MNKIHEEMLTENESFSVLFLLVHAVRLHKT